MQQDDFRFQDLIDSIRQRKWTVAAITTLFVAVAGVAALVIPKKYSATIVVAPAESRSIGGGGMSSLASEFGGIASIAGLSMGGDSRKSEAVATLQSDILARAYVQKKNLLPVLFADKWDAAAGKWREPEPGRIPTLWKASQLIDKTIRTVTENPKSGLVTVTITWTDPKLAAEWANDLVTATNDHLRSKAVVQIERNIDFLEKQAAATNIAELRSAIYSILESEIKNAMLARGTDEYALKVIDPAVPPERHTSPKLSIWVGVALLSGLTVAVLFVLLSAAKPNE